MKMVYSVMNSFCYNMSIDSFSAKSCNFVNKNKRVGQVKWLLF